MIVRQRLLCTHQGSCAQQKKSCMEKLKLEVEKYIQGGIDIEWKEFSSQLSVHTASKREIIFRQTDICDRVIYILEGIAAL